MPQLAPPPKFRAVGADGLALVGGKLYTYTEGTSTPKATYTDFGLGTANTNPVILDARGEADVWLDGSYKLVLKDADDVTIWTVDSIRDLTQNQTFTGVTLAGTLTVNGSAVTWGGNPTHSGNHTFSGNVTVNGNTTLGNASSDTLTIAPNAVTWSNNPTHSGNHTWSGTHVFNGAVTVGDTAADALTIAGSAVTWSGNPTHSGNHTFSNAITAPNLGIGAVYTPTLTGVANIASTTLYGAMYSRNGSIVTASVYFQADSTSTGVTSIGISLPVSSSFTLGYDCIGVSVTSDAGENTASIETDTVNDRAQMSYTAVSTGAVNWRVLFQYIVK